MSQENSTTHIQTYFFPKTNRTMSFYHRSLQRYFSVQVTIIFYKRELDNTDIEKMNVVKKKVQELGVRGAMFPSWLCCRPAERTCGNAVSPPSVSVCSSANWNSQVPSWCSPGDLQMEAHWKFKKQTANKDVAWKQTVAACTPVWTSIFIKGLVGLWSHKYHQRTFKRNFGVVFRC